MSVSPEKEKVDMGITQQSYEEHYGGKVICFLEASFEGECIYSLALPEAEIIGIAAELEHHGATVVVRKWGEIIFGAK